MTDAEPPGWHRAAADSDEGSAADSVTVTYPGFIDVVDLVRYNFLDDLADVLDALADYGYHFTDDPLDWIRENPDHDLATLCPACGERWLFGREALSAGRCWQCRA
jgi:hypothetical protein